MPLSVEPSRVIEGWGFGSGIESFGTISAVAVDSNDTVYVLSRSPRGVMHRFDRDGQWIDDWDVDFGSPHGLWIGPDDRVFVTDLADHTVRIYEPNGALLQTIGTPGVAGQAGRPFAMPTRAIAGPSGDIYVSDGYGQDWVHRFRADGTHVLSWGGTGSDPGQFRTPHSLWVDAEERVYVVDRANGRVQVFDADGRILDIWGGFCFPHDIVGLADGSFVVTDCATREDATRPYHEQLPAEPLVLFSPEGRRIGATGRSGVGPGRFCDCPHSVWVGADGAVYVSEVISPDRLQAFGPA